jgi:hypothetical protein
MVGCLRLRHLIGRSLESRHRGPQATRHTLGFLHIAG